MTWLRIDDEFTTHAKVASLSDGAVRLWLEASCWSRKPANLKHEGRIPEALLVSIAQNRYPRAKALKLAAELVAANGGGLYEHGLWTVVEGGWQIHDWRVYGIIEQDPDSLSAKRSEAGRKGAVARWQSDSKPPGCHADANGSAMPPIPTPSPIPIPEGEERARQVSESRIKQAPPAGSQSAAARQILALRECSPEDRAVLEAWKSRFNKSEVVFTADRTIYLAERRSEGISQQDALDALDGAAADEWFIRQGAKFSLVFNKRERFETYRDVGRAARIKPADRPLEQKAPARWVDPDKPDLAKVGFPEDMAEISKGLLK